MSLPDPLVPAHVDLRSFQYMPLDVLRLRDSRLAVTVGAEGFRSAVLLWCAAWHQVPAASLPNDDVELVLFAGLSEMLTRYRRDVNEIDKRCMSHWRRIKAICMRGFVLCSDDRWYHPVIAEKAIEAWNAKQKQRNRTSSATAARIANASRNDIRNDDRNVDVSKTVTVTKGTEHIREIKEKIQKKEKIVTSRKSTPCEILKTVLSPKTADDVVAHRKAKRAPLTPRAAELLVAAFRDHGNPEEAAAAMILHGWQGFEPKWLSVSNPRAGPPPRSNGVEGYAKLVFEDIENGKIEHEQGLSERSNKGGSAKSVTRDVPLLPSRG